MKLHIPQQATVADSAVDLPLKVEGGCGNLYLFVISIYGGSEYVIGRLEPGPPPWTESTDLMSVLQSIQIDPTDCKSVLAKIQIDLTAFHKELGLNRPGADCSFGPGRVISL
jgi:hypothetical protein